MNKFKNPVGNNRVFFIAAIKAQRHKVSDPIFPHVPPKGHFLLTSIRGPGVGMTENIYAFIRAMASIMASLRGTKQSHMIYGLILDCFVPRNDDPDRDIAMI